MCLDVGFLSYLFITTFNHLVHIIEFLIVIDITILILVNSLNRCILDGEMLVWDTAAQRFAEFGSNQEIGI